MADSREEHSKVPVIKSAKKRARQAPKRQDRNYVVRKQVKDARKSLAAAQAKGDNKKVAEATSALQSALDIAVKKNIIHKNKAARLKSRSIVAGKKPAAKKTTAKKPTTKKATAKKTAAKN